MAQRSSAKAKKKVYITTDLEGASGLVTARHHGDIGTEGSEMYQKYRRFLTQDVNAAVQGAFEGGAEEVVVNDGHGTADHNILPGELDERAELERPAAGAWLPSLDGTFAAVFCMGCHAMAGTSKGFLDHTQSSTSIYDWQLNGIHVGEIGQTAAIAGHFGVPLVFVTGDGAACREARKLVGPIETVAVKEGLARNHARGLHPAVAQRLIRAAAGRAMERLGEIKPFVLKTPITMRVTYMRSDYAEETFARKRRYSRLLDARTVETQLRDILDMFG
jgi:D-amino peptidase